MKVIVVDDKKNRNNKIEYKLNFIFEWIIYMLGYAIILILTSNLFRPLYIENFMYGLIAAILIYIFNKTVKPLIVRLTLPIIGLSLGLFYFVINVFVLALVDMILGPHFELTGIFSPFVVSIFISIMNLIMEYLIIKPLIERLGKHNG